MAFLYFSDASTDPGHVRRQNEDAVHDDRALGIHFVVDGMGGQAAGEQAARIAVDELRKRLENSQGTPERRIREAITMANNAIYRQAEERPDWRGMGCVLTVALVDGGRLHWGHVGDTRLYKLHGGAIRKLTLDHSPVGEREDANELSERDAMRHPRRNEVYRDVGSQPHQPDDACFIDTGSESFEPDAAFLLCSDGLSDVLTKDEIHQIVREHAGHPKRVTGRLIEAAADNGKDNISVVYLEGPRFAPSNSRPGEETGTWRPPGKARSRRVAFLLAALAASIAGLAAGFRAGTEKLPRQLEVGPGAFASISEAMDRARPGDRVLVAPGDYRELVRLKSGVTLEGQPGAALLGPGNPAEPVITVEGVKGARIGGFALHPDENRWWETAVRILDSEVILERLQIEGATGPAIRFMGASGGMLLGNWIRRNRAVGVMVSGASQPRIEHNVFEDNGSHLVWDSSAPPLVLRNVFDRRPPAPLDGNIYLEAPPAPAKGPRGSAERTRP